MDNDDAFRALCVFLGVKRLFCLLKEERMAVKDRILYRGKQALLPLGILFIWFICSHLSIWSNYVLPTPEKVW